MRVKAFKKRSKWQLLRNLRKYQTILKNSGVKMMITAIDLMQTVFYVDVTITLEL